MVILCHKYIAMATTTCITIMKMIMTLCMAAKDMANHATDSPSMRMLWFVKVLPKAWLGAKSLHSFPTVSELRVSTVIVHCKAFVNPDDELAASVCRHRPTWLLHQLHDVLLLSRALPVASAHLLLRLLFHRQHGSPPRTMLQPLHVIGCLIWWWIGRPHHGWMIIILIMVVALDTAFSCHGNSIGVETCMHVSSYHHHTHSSSSSLFS